MDLPATEERAAQGRALDLLAPEELALLFADEARLAAEAVAAARVPLARAIERARDALAAGGRLILCGAGTSGRLAVIEAAECWPTFSSEQVVACMAGGPAAFLAAREGAEDDADAGAAELRQLDPAPRDLVLGVTASGRTPYVYGALEAARAAGAGAALLCCAPPPASRLSGLDPVIVLATGPEALTGSTRLKAGTATKVALNAITTGSMALTGKVLDDLMVDVRPTNAKLRARAARIVAALVPDAPTPEAHAASLLELAGGELKTAVVMGRRGLDAAAARAALEQAGGHLRRALDPDAAGLEAAP